MAEKDKTTEEALNQTETEQKETAAAVEQESSQDETVEKQEDKKLTVEEKVSELEKQNADLKDQYLRKVADFDNYRKRMIREKQEAFDYANTAILTDLVAVLDDFDRGLTAAAEAKDVKAVVDGIKMINKQMHGFLDSKYNLTSYGEKGDLFDPNIHEAIASEQTDVAEPTCAEVYLKGYLLKDRVIRHAKVMVHMPKTETKNEENKTE